MNSQKGRDEKGGFAQWGTKQILKVSHKQSLLARAKYQLEITLEAWGEGIEVMLSILTEKEEN